jgi:FMN phosphatase YigB (HAD superfamily)
MSTPRVIVFDLLTALLDSWSLWNAVAGDDASGRRWRARYLELTFGCGVYQPYEDLVRQAAFDTGLSVDSAITLLTRWDELQPWPEASDVLQDLKERGYRIAVVTNCSKELGHRAAARCGVEFDAVVTAEEAGSTNPMSRHISPSSPRWELTIPLPRCLLLEAMVMSMARPKQAWRWSGIIMSDSLFFREVLRP